MRWKSEEQQISFDIAVNERNLNTALAKQLIRLHGEGAHLVALEQMLNDEAKAHTYIRDKMMRTDWRQVLEIIDELTKGESNEGI